MQKELKQLIKKVRVVGRALPLFTLFLIGCGAEKQNPQVIYPEVTPPPQNYVVDGVNMVETNTTTYIDFHQYINATNISITSVEVVDGHEACGDPKIEGVGIFVTPTENRVCDYNYTLTADELGQTSAKLTVISDSERAFVLPQIDKKIFPDGHTLTVDLAETLGDIIWKDTYKLIPDKIYLQSIDLAPAIASGEGSVINAKVTFVGGWTRVLYYVEDSANPDQVIYGVIYIHVDTTNVPKLPIEISNKDYTYNEVERRFDSYLSPNIVECIGGVCDNVMEYLAKGKTNKLELMKSDTISTINIENGDSSFDDTLLMITVSQSMKVAVNIDGEHLGDFCRDNCSEQVLKLYHREGKWVRNPVRYSIYPGSTINVNLLDLTDLVFEKPDKEPWQLLNVLSFGTTEVKVKNPNDVTNKEFTFKASSPGDKVVSYVVGDHHTNYDSGVMRFYVEDPTMYPCYGIEGNFSCMPVGSSQRSRMFATPAYSIQALAAVGVSDIGSYTEQGANGWETYRMEVGIMTFDQAEAFCKQLSDMNFGERIDWHIPTASEFNDYRFNEKPTDNHWPFEKPYWVIDNDGTPKPIKLTTGSVDDDYNYLSSIYVTCFSLN